MAKNASGTSAPKQLQLTVVAPAVLTSAGSLHSHTGTGIFEIPLPLTGPAGVECRQGVPRLVFRFAQPLLEIAGVTVSGGGEVYEPSINGNELSCGLMA
jgi:hypothetical protein